MSSNSKIEKPNPSKNSSATSEKLNDQGVSSDFPNGGKRKLKTSRSKTHNLFSILFGMNSSKKSGSKIFTFLLKFSGSMDHLEQVRVPKPHL